MCKMQKRNYLPSSDRMGTFFWQLQHTKLRGIVSVPIYKLKCAKSTFSKRGRCGMINVKEDEVEL